MKKVVLALGEATGHSHVACGESLDLVDPYDHPFEMSSCLVVSAPSGAEVLHEEHKPITLPAGVYERTIVREYDHFLEESRVVLD